jgi:outer membrane protein assembly factor BamD
MVARLHRLVPAALLAATFAFALPACGGKGGTGKVEYSVSAKQNYGKGVDKLKDEDWIAAAKYFAFIKARFPYSKFAVLAELRMADAEFGAGHYLQAIDSYKMFIKFHPTHEMVANGYGSFRIGEAYYRMLPGDFWLLPPSYEKDQSATSDAHRELASFLRKYPKSPFGKKAKKMVVKCARRLARHEWYVAKFYWERGKPMGTVLRLRRLTERYSGVGFDEEALWLLGKAYRKVDMPKRARDAWQELIDKYPRHDRAGEARAAIRKLPG